MDTKGNTLNWFEVPVSDFDRAKKFYETVFNIQLYVMDFGGFKMGLFPATPATASCMARFARARRFRLQKMERWSISIAIPISKPISTA